MSLGMPKAALGGQACAEGQRWQDREGGPWSFGVRVLGSPLGGRREGGRGPPFTPARSALIRHCAKRLTKTTVALNRLTSARAI